MNNSPKEILTFVEENDVKFIRLTFCDVFGNLKNIAVMPNELEQAFSCGLPFDSAKFDPNAQELLLIPDISTLSVLPWRPKSGRVVRFFCNMKNPDGSDYSADMRTNLIKYINEIRHKGYSCEISTRCEFYLFDLDEKSEPTRIPHDKGGYLDVAPLDKCENVRREICLSLEEMGLNPKSSCHKHGPAQNEIDFRANKPVNAADDMMHYKTIVKSIAAQCGLFASFMPLPLENEHGSALNISFMIKKNGENIFGSAPDSLTFEGKCFISGILRRIGEITAFLNPTVNSYSRFGVGSAPKKINFSANDHSALVRLSAIYGISTKIEIRSADAACNPYIAFKLILAAGIEGISEGNPILYKDFPQKLPDNLGEALKIAENSSFIRENLPEKVRDIIFTHQKKQLEILKSYENEQKFSDNFYFPYI